MSAVEPKLLPQRPSLMLEPSQKMEFWRIVICAACLFVSFFEVKTRPIIGAASILLFGAALFGSLRMLVKGSTYLSLDSEGFTLSMGGNKFVVPWADVKSLQATWTGTESFQISWNQLVMVDRVLSSPTMFQRLNHSSHLWIYPHVFGMNAVQLAATMAPYLDDARRKIEDERVKPQAVA